MAKVRVSTLAKEFGMTSKELMGHLADMKIPAKSASSTLEDAYVAMVRKQLASVIEARAKEVEAAKQAEEEAAAAELADAQDQLAVAVRPAQPPAAQPVEQALAALVERCAHHSPAAVRNSASVCASVNPSMGASTDTNPLWRCTSWLYSHSIRAASF